MEREHVFCAGHIWWVGVAAVLTHKTTLKASITTRLVRIYPYLRLRKENEDAISPPTSPWNCGVVKDGEVVIGASVTLLQVEAHPSELDDVSRGSHYHPTTVHPMRILLRLQDQEICSESKFLQRSW